MCISISVILALYSCTFKRNGVRTVAAKSTVISRLLSTESYRNVAVTKGKNGKWTNKNGGLTQQKCRHCHEKFRLTSKNQDLTQRCDVTNTNARLTKKFVSNVQVVESDSITDKTRGQTAPGNEIRIFPIPFDLSVDMSLWVFPESWGYPHMVGL